MKQARMNGRADGRVVVLFVLFLDPKIVSRVSSSAVSTTPIVRFVFCVFSSVFYTQSRRLASSQLSLAVSIEDKVLSNLQLCFI